MHSFVPLLQILLSCPLRLCRSSPLSFVRVVVWLWSAAMNGKGKSDACVCKRLRAFDLVLLS